MAMSAPRPIGHRRGVDFHVAQLDVATAAVDLLVVAMPDFPPGSAPPRGGAGALDRALHGTLSRLHAGGIFTGFPGETLMLTRPPPPILARLLLLLGLGPAGAGDAAMLGALAGLAMAAALRVRAESVACLLGWSDLDLPADQVGPAAAAMMDGALAALDAQGGLPPGRALDWTFDIRNGHAAATAAALAQALRRRA